MPRKKRTSKLRPKTPSRIKKRRPATKKPRSLQHPELWGLGFVALGAFLASVVYFGWNGGYVGRALADGFDAVIGRASWGLPVLLVVLGCLMVARSALVDVRPFRTGLAVLGFGLGVGEVGRCSSMRNRSVGGTTRPAAALGVAGSLASSSGGASAVGSGSTAGSGASMTGAADA